MRLCYARQTPSPEVKSSREDNKSETPDIIPVDKVFRNNQHVGIPNYLSSVAGSCISHSESHEINGQVHTVFYSRLTVMTFRSFNSNFCIGNALSKDCHWKSFMFAPNELALKGLQLKHGLRRNMGIFIYWNCDNPIKALVTLSNDKPPGHGIDYSFLSFSLYILCKILPQQNYSIASSVSSHKLAA